MHHQPNPETHESPQNQRKTQEWSQNDQMDAIARYRLRLYLTREGIAEGHGADVLINRWLRDPAGTGAYRIPDVHLLKTRTIIDGTIGRKTLMSPQIQDFMTFSNGSQVIIVTPRIGPGFGPR